MLTWVLGAGVAVLGWLVWRHLKGRRCPYLIAFMVVGLLVAGAVEVRHRSMEARYSAAVSTLLDRKDTFVVCERLSGTMFNAWNRAGYVEWTLDGSKPSRADLTWDTCRDLRAWEDETHVAGNPEQVIALHVLTHEAMHLDGHYDEATAECLAMQADAEMARLLGATAARAQELADTYARDMYPRMREGYTSPDCVQGGPMDATPNDDVWP